jgi:2,3-bisphosphoglycerate-independent phosphoglycerate mutase
VGVCEKDAEENIWIIERESKTSIEKISTMMNAILCNIYQILRDHEINCN